MSGKLDTARSKLDNFERLFEDPRGRRFLEEGLDLLWGVLESDANTAEKDKARHVVETYRRRSLDKIRNVLEDHSNIDGAKAKLLNDIIDAFINAGFEAQGLLTVQKSMLWLWVLALARMLTTDERKKLIEELDHDHH